MTETTETTGTSGATETNGLGTNPLLAWGTLPDYPGIEAHHVEPAMKVALEAANDALTMLESEVAALPPGQVAELVGRLEALEDRFGYTWGLVNHLNSVRTSDALRAAIQAVQPEVVRFFARLGQSRPVFSAYERAMGEGIAEPALRRVVELALRGMRHSGIGLDGEARERFNANQEALAELSLAYGNALVDGTKAWSRVLESEDDVVGLPPSTRALLAQSAALAGLTRDGEAPSAERGPWRLTLDAPCVIPFLEYAERRELREALYRAYIGRAGPDGDPAHDNTGRVLEILKLRKEQAALLGFADFAAYSLDAKMAPDVDAVNKLLLSLHGKSREAAVRELAELSAFAVDSGNKEALQLWDVAFWARRLREARFSYSDEDLKPYFPLPAVLAGAFSLVEKLFGVRVAKKDGVVGWHPDVSYYEVTDGGRVVASFFLDPYSRPADKRSGAWMNELRGRSARLAPDGQRYRTPIAYLVCNQAPPIGGAPSLMTWNEVSTLFHELGHGLQHMLTAVDHLAVSGINGVEWDAVELPSQFMENFLRHKAFLRSFARHYQNGDPIPDTLVHKVLAATTFRAGSAFLRQLYFGRLDLALHTGEPPADAEALWGLMHRVAAENTVIAPLPEDRFLCSFGHLFAGGYAAGYYSYKWAEVLSADAYAAFEEAGLDDDEAVAAVGRRFRDTVLGLGGSVPPMEVFVRFRGREPDAEALLRHNGLAA